jgi:hypothetical protein
VSDDQDRIRQIQERLAELQRQNTDPLTEPDTEQDRPQQPASPVVAARQPGKRRGWKFLAALLLVAFVLGELAITLQGYSVADFKEADRVGQATVLSCERRGPIGWGFGYWDECTADITWEGGFLQRHTFDQRNFLHADEVGKTVTIGQGTGFRGGGTTYSRPGLPERPLIVAAGVTLAVLAFILVLFLLAALLFAIRNAIRHLLRR